MTLFSSHFIVHVSSHLLQSTLLLFTFHLISFFGQQSVSFISSTIVHLIHIYQFGYTYIISPFNVIATFTFQPIPPMEINYLRVSC